MPVFYSVSRGGFFDPSVHDPMPKDAVRVTSKRHRELVEAQERGARIVPGDGSHPALLWPGRSVSAMRHCLIRSVKREARRRIEAISPPWRQLNDLRVPSPEGAARFAMIDAIRRAGAQIELEIGGSPIKGLEKFDVRGHSAWPEETTS